MIVKGCGTTVGSDGVMDRGTLRRLQGFRAEAIPGTAIRNQGAPGVLGVIRAFLRRLHLSRFGTRNRAEFEAHLDAETERLRRKLPHDAQNWGAARKAINLFLRDCTYDYHLRARHGLAAIEPWLEVPLDADVAERLQGGWAGRALPPWPGLKHLDRTVSVQYQEVAQRVADRKGICRVHLDLYWWRDRRRALGPEIETRGR